MANVIQVAQGMHGTPYVWGGNTPGHALDCSGFVQQAYKAVGINLPRTTYDQFKVGKSVGLNQLQPGDLVFTEPSKAGPQHVGMYVGHGQIQESPHSGDVNKFIPLNDFLNGGFAGAKRVSGGAPAAAPAQGPVLAQGLQRGAVAPSPSANLVPLIQMLMQRNQQAPAPVTGFKPF